MKHRVRVDVSVNAAAFPVVSEQMFFKMLLFSLTTAVSDKAVTSHIAAPGVQVWSCAAEAAYGLSVCICVCECSFFIFQNTPARPWLLLLQKSEHWIMFSVELVCRCLLTFTVISCNLSLCLCCCCCICDVNLDQNQNLSQFNHHWQLMRKNCSQSNHTGLQDPVCVSVCVSLDVITCSSSGGGFAVGQHMERFIH